MTIAELIGIADELVENPFSTGVKLMLVNEIEGRIQHDLFQMAPDQVVTYTQDDITAETELVIGTPWNQVYLTWMKSMYYWHMAEYDSYQNEREMFNNEWIRLSRTVSEHEYFGTSTEPAWRSILPTRLLAGRIVINQVSYDADTGSWSTDRSFTQLQELIEAGGYVVCRVTGWRDNVFFMPLVQTAANWLAFACGQDWNKGTSEYIHAMLWIKSSGAIEFLLDET